MTGNPDGRIGIAIDRDDQVVTIAGERQLGCGDPVLEEHSIVTTAGVVDGVLTAAIDITVVVGTTDQRVEPFLTAQSVVTGISSEEHTSELQSLMRISYDVFCLKTKK